MTGEMRSIFIAGEPRDFRKTSACRFMQSPHHQVEWHLDQEKPRK